MKHLLILALVATLTVAKPNGYFHEEHQSYASSQSFKGNELQHQTEDESYYSKNGDLEGRVKPKVNAHSQHSEYVNPKLKNNGNSNYYDGLTGQHLGTTGYGLNNHYDGGLDYGSSNFGSSSFGHQQSANLRQNVVSLQSELQSDLQRALDNYHKSQNYQINDYNQAESDRRGLETELRRNITTKFEALKTYHQSGQQQQHHQQGIKQPYNTRTYNNQELEDLTRQTQDSLLRQLAEGTRSQYQYSASSNQVRQSGARVVPLAVNPQTSYAVPESSHIVPVRTYRPEPVVQNQPVYVSVPTNDYQPSMESILESATRVQNNLNEQLNLILDNIKDKYLQTNTYTTQDFLNNLKIQLQDDIKSNITIQLREEFGRAFGYNQKINNFDDLKRQMENNLLTKLNREFDKQVEFYLSNRTRQQNSHTVYQPSYTTYVSTNNNNNQEVDLTELKQRIQQKLQQQLQTALRSNAYRNNNYQTVLHDLRNELNQNLTQHLDQIKTEYSSINAADLANLRNQLQDDLQKQLQNSWSSYSSWSSQSSWSYQPSSSSLSTGTVDLNDVKNQLQQQMQRQIQNAINEQRYNSYSNNYQTTLQHLTNELNQNLTQHLNHLKNQYRDGSNSIQFDNIKNQLEDDLRNQLQQGLQRSWSSYSSWSGSASYGTQSDSSNGEISQIKRQLENQLHNQVQSALRQQQSYQQQSSLQELQDELNRNLTRQLQQLRSQSQYYGSGYDTDFANLQNQLQGDLQKQLQQGYSSYSSSSSYSSRSSAASAGSGSGYRPTRGYNYVGGVSGAMIGVDCDDQQQQQQQQYRQPRLYKRNIIDEPNESISESEVKSNSEQSDDSILNKIIDDVSIDSDQNDDLTSSHK